MQIWETHDGRFIHFSTHRTLDFEHTTELGSRSRPEPMIETNAHQRSSRNSRIAARSKISSAP